jgi:hypothetical protein
MQNNAIGYVLFSLMIVSIIFFFGGLIFFLYDPKITLYTILPFALFIILAIIIVVMIFFGQFSNGDATTTTTDIKSDIGPNSNKTAQQTETDNTSRKLLLEGPISLYNNLSTSIPGMQPLPQSPNYTFSFWLYPNNSAQFNSFQIFKFGDSAPYITFGGANNALRLFASKPFVTKKQSTTITIPTQKWNYIVVQYVGGTSVQFYVNCNLISTVALDPTNTPTYTTNDMLYIGNHNPISIGIGAISNVNYYTTPLTNTQMQYQYVTLSSQSVPTSF